MTTGETAPALWLVRHAAVQIDTGLCYGRLDVRAHDDATDLAAQALEAALPQRIAGVLVSPRKRCSQLADALRVLRPQLRPTVDPRLAEMDFGTWEGQRWDAIGASAMEAWSTDFGTHSPGGGERVNDFLSRVGAVWDETEGAALQGTADAGDIVWIVHAGVARAAMLWRAGFRDLSSAAQWPREGLDFGCWQQVPLQRNR
jgi:alpha-ribazole phosphatase